jgi:hypothetical protein
MHVRNVFREFLPENGAITRLTTNNFDYYSKIPTFYNIKHVLRIALKMTSSLTSNFYALVLRRVMKDWRCTRLCRVFAVYSFSTTRKEQITRIFVAWDIYMRPVRNVFLPSK